MMVVSTDQWRAEIGSFNCHRLRLSKFKWNNNQMFLKIVFIYFLLMCKVLNTKFCLSKLATRLMFHWKAFFILYALFVCSLLLLHGDIESNPGPRNSKNYLPSFCHWNLNSLPAYNFSKLLLLKAYNAIYKYDFICLPETFLDFSIPSDHVSWELEGYKFDRADHPNNVKRGRVCIYDKESFMVRLTNLPYLQEALLIELNDQNKKIINNSEEFESFLTNFEHLLSDINARKPSVSVILGNFNARSTTWRSSKVDSLESSKLFSLRTLNSFH